MEAIYGLSNTWIFGVTTPSYGRFCVRKVMPLIATYPQRILKDVLLWLLLHHRAWYLCMEGDA